MLKSKPRPGASETPSRGCLSSPKSVQTTLESIRGVNFQAESTDLKAVKMFDKKLAYKTSHGQEKRHGRGSEMMQPQQFHQLQEELRRTREETTRALEDLEELRSNKRLSALSNKEEIESLEKKVEKARDSERKMLESMISQTKQIEQTKMLLEEAKLEIRSLKDNIKSLEESSSHNSFGNVGKQQFPLDLTQVQEEISMLRNELKLATQAEEKSKKAMDDLAIALKEVTTEASQVKMRLFMSQSELEKLKFESGQSKTRNDKLCASAEETERWKLDSEDLATVWKEKENGLINCIEVSEEEINKLQLENNKLIETLRGSRGEASKLRDIVKQAVNEATVVKEALEIVRNENSQLKDLLAEKENSLQSIKQDYECLKVSEATAVDSVKELKGFLAATSSIDDFTIKTSTNEVNETRKIMKLPSDRLWRGDPRLPRHGRRHSIGGFAKLKGSSFGSDNQEMEQKNQLFPSLSNVSDSRVPSSILHAEDGETLSTFDFDHTSETQANGTDNESDSSMRQKKKKPMLKKFGEMLRGRSFHRF